jgi:adenylate kinase
MNKFLIFGPQGSGKGTQGERLCKEFGFVHIAVGDLFRWHMVNKTKLAAKVTRIMNQGLLVPDEIVFQVVQERLDQHDWNYGFILDGFPRTIPQAEFLFERWNMDAVIGLEIPDAVVLERVATRVAQSGGKPRPDDTPEALTVRLREYHEKTAPLVDLYDAKGILQRFDATQSIDDVYNEIVARFQLRK